VGCLSYNKWGRPNPPYVFFKYGGKDWQRIQIAELPVEFKTINVAFGMPWDIRDREVKFDKGDLLTAETIKLRNEEINIPQKRTILRDAYQYAAGECPELVLYKGAWIMPNDPVMHRMLDRKNK